MREMLRVTKPDDIVALVRAISRPNVSDPNCWDYHKVTVGMMSAAGGCPADGLRSSRGFAMRDAIDSQANRKGSRLELLHCDKKVQLYKWSCNQNSKRYSSLTPKLIIFVDHRSRNIPIC